MDYKTQGEASVYDRDLIFFDTETTGFELDKEIIEIGFVKAKARTFELIEEGDIKIKPQHLERASAEALAIVGFDPAEWEREGMAQNEGIAEFLKHTADCVLVGHNLPFDWMHVMKEVEECGLTPNFFYKGLDTFAFAWVLLSEKPELSRFSLEQLARHFGIDKGRSHRAIDDARTTYQVFLKLVAAARQGI